MFSSPRKNNYNLVESDDDEGVLCRYRVIASGPFPARVECIDDTNGHLLDSCVLGGVLWKLQQFCRLQQKGANFWRTHGMLLGVYVVLVLGLGLLLDGNRHDPKEEGPSIQEEKNRWTLGLGLVVVTVLYFLILIFLGAGLWISQTFRTKLNDYVQEISEQLEPLGLKLAPDTKASNQHRSSHIVISLKRLTSSPISALPPVTDDFLKYPSKEFKATVDSILYYGGHNPSLTTAERRYPLPVDDWIAGGLLIRLRKERHRASQFSRLLAFLVLLPLGGICFLHLAFASKRNASSDETKVFHPLHILAFITICGSSALVYFYIREFLDGTSLHAVSRSVVKQFSALAKERHDISLQYEVQPGECLPRTTKGVIRFQPVGIPEPQKRKPKATLAFV